MSTWKMFGREKNTEKRKKEMLRFFLETRKRNCDRDRHLLNEETLKKILFVVFLFLFLSRSNEDERNQLLNGVEGGIADIIYSLVGIFLKM